MVKGFFRNRRPIFLGTAGGGGSSILFFNLFILSDPPNCIMWHNRLGSSENAKHFVISTQNAQNYLSSQGGLNK